MGRGVDPARLARLRGASQRLHRPAAVRHPADVARLAGPVQAQEPRAAKLAFRARARGLVAADVDRARTEERSLLRAWMMRRTVHLIATEDAGWLLPLFSETIVRLARKRLADFGLDRRGQDRALAVLHARGRRRRRPDPPRARRAPRAGGVRHRERVQGPPVGAGDARRRALPRARPGRADVPRADRRLDRRAAAPVARGLARRARAPLPPRLRARGRARPRALGGPAAARREARVRPDRGRAHPRRRAVRARPAAAGRAVAGGANAGRRSTTTTSATSTAASRSPRSSRSA